MGGMGILPNGGALMMGIPEMEEQNIQTPLAGSAALRVRNCKVYTQAERHAQLLIPLLGHFHQHGSDNMCGSGSKCKIH